MLENYNYQREESPGMRIKQALHVLVVCLCAIATTTAVAENKYSELVVFGDSLSDPGNVYELTGTSSVRPFDAGKTG